MKRRKESNKKFARASNLKGSQSISIDSKEAMSFVNMSPKKKLKRNSPKNKKSLN